MKRLSSGLSSGKLAALLIAFFTLAASLVVNNIVFERFPHLEDEFGYLYQAKIFAGGHPYVVRDAPAKDFWQPFVLQPDNPVDGIEKRFGKYTPGWPLLLAAGVLIGWPVLVNSFLAMFSVLFVYRLGKEIFSEAVGLVAALLLAVSPMALLLNASLMSHTSSMFLAIVFTYGYWRVTRPGKRDSRRRYLWAAIAGLALGWFAASRPLSAISIVIPFVLHAASQLLDAASGPRWFNKFVETLKPLIVLSVFVLPTMASWPLMNYIWTGSPTTNTYTLLWSYDKPGFGEGYGLNKGGHSIEYGWRNVRQDMQVYLRDLFGVTMTEPVESYLKSNLGWGAGIGLSWVLILAGLIAGRKNEWTWLFFLIFVALVGGQMTYWIGSVVRGGAAYSLRYWYESTYAMCMVGAVGVVSWVEWLNTRWQTFWAKNGTKYSPFKSKAVTITYLNGVERIAPVRVLPRAANFAQWLTYTWQRLWPGYILLLVACGVTLIGYTPERFREPLPPDWPTGLYHYNKIGQYQLDAIQQARNTYGKPGQPVLILVLNDPGSVLKDDWRNYGVAMALTSPYLTSDIVLARPFEKDEAETLVKRFPDRLVLYQLGPNLYPTIDAAYAGAEQQIQEANELHKP